MVKAKTLQTDLAEQDLIELWLHIAQDSPTQADRFLDTIAKRLRLLARSPRIGRPRDELGVAVRSFPVGDYLVFYRPIAGGIVVLRVVSGYRDLLALWDRESIA